MKTNLVAQFSCSFVKNTDPQRSQLKEYQVVNGATFTDNYNETLDSGSIVVSQVNLEDRLIGIKPYDFIRVYDKNTYSSQDNTYEFEKIYLLDNYYERETNISEHIFSYTVSLMSITKLLEKIQCPNISITHDIGQKGEITKKTIYEYICQYMDLYIQKVKMYIEPEDVNPNNFIYEPLIFVPDSTSEFFNKFNVTCADMNLTLPTLRQLLTTLMQQVNCIPKVVYNKEKNRLELSYLDFAKEAEPFAISESDYSLNNTVNFIQRGNSSDSYANNIVNINSSVLDSNSEVVCESIGFRDKDSFTLKQQENLYLETKLPIFKINKVFLKNGICFEKYNEELIDLPQTESVICKDANQKYLSGNNLDYGLRIGYTASGKIIFWNISASDHLNDDGWDEYGFSWKIKNLKIHFCKTVRDNVFSKKIYNSAEEFVIDNKTLNTKIVSKQGTELEFNDFILGDWEEKNDPIITEPPFSINSSFLEFNIEDFINLPSEPYQTSDLFDLVWIECEAVKIKFLIDFIPASGIITNYEEVGSEINTVGAFLNTNGAESEWVTSVGVSSYQTKINTSIRCDSKIDITSLVVENQVRSYLNVNFIELCNEQPTTLEQFAKYIYGTVGYSSGSNQITGFSTTYSYGKQEVGDGIIGWYSISKTIIENIINFILIHIRNGDITSDFYSIDSFPSSAIHNYPLKINIENFTVDNLNLENILLNKVSPTSTESNFIDSILNLATGEQQNLINYSLLVFDIYYQPFNKYNMNFSKQIEDIPFTLEQLNSSGDAISDFDRLSVSQQEQIDRIGNDTITITQRTDNYDYVRPIPTYFLDDLNRDDDYNDELENTKYIIFSRTISINNYCYNVSYTGAKDAILKNYFTSIRTKYRAYQNIPYSNAINRCESDNIFVYIGTDYFFADNKIWFGYYDINFKNNPSFLAGCKKLISGMLTEEQVKDEPILALYERNWGSQKTYKNEVSYTANKNSWTISYEDFSNISAGIKLAKFTSGLKGLPQQWYIFDDNFYEAPQLVYATKNSVDYKELVQNNSKSYDSLVLDLPLSPLVTNSVLMNSEYNLASFTLCDDNTNDFDGLQYTIYKDISERISHTLQFTYYTNSPDIIWTDKFIQGCSFVNIKSMRPNAIMYFEDNAPFYVSNELKRLKSTDTYITGDDFINNYPISINSSVDRVLGFNILWGNPLLQTEVNSFKLIYLNDDGTYYDIIAFRNKEISTYYVSLNDTKSKWAMQFLNGVLCKKEEITTNENLASSKVYKESNITLDMNGGEYGGTTFNKNEMYPNLLGKNITNNVIISLPIESINGLHRSEYNFNGWYSDKDFTSEVYTHADVRKGRNQYYYAKWTAAPLTISLPKVTISQEVIAGELINSVSSLDIFNNSPYNIFASFESAIRAGVLGTINIDDHFEDITIEDLKESILEDFTNDYKIYWFFSTTNAAGEYLELKLSHCDYTISQNIYEHTLNKTVNGHFDYSVNRNSTFKFGAGIKELNNDDTLYDGDRLSITIDNSSIESGYRRPSVTFNDNVNTSSGVNYVKTGVNKPVVTLTHIYAPFTMSEIGQIQVTKTINESYDGFNWEVTNFPAITNNNEERVGLSWTDNYEDSTFLTYLYVDESFTLSDLTNELKQALIEDCKAKYLSQNNTAVFFTMLTTLPNPSFGEIQTRQVLNYDYVQPTDYQRNLVFNDHEQVTFAVIRASSLFGGQPGLVNAGTDVLALGDQIAIGISATGSRRHPYYTSTGLIDSAGGGNRVIDDVVLTGYSYTPFEFESPAIQLRKFVVNGNLEYKAYSFTCSNYNEDLNGVSLTWQYDDKNGTFNILKDHILSLSENLLENDFGDGLVENYLNPGELQLQLTSRNWSEDTINKIPQTSDYTIIDEINSHTLNIRSQQGINCNVIRVETFKDGAATGIILEDNDTVYDGDKIAVGYSVSSEYRHPSISTANLTLISQTSQYFQVYYVNTNNNYVNITTNAYDPFVYYPCQAQIQKYISAGSLSYRIYSFTQENTNYDPSGVSLIWQYDDEIGILPDIDVRSTLNLNRNDLTGEYSDFGDYLLVNYNEGGNSLRMRMASKDWSEDTATYSIPISRYSIVDGIESHTLTVNTSFYSSTIDYCTVYRQSTFKEDASTGYLYDNDTIYDGDVLKITVGFDAADYSLTDISGLNVVSSPVIVGQELKATYYVNNNDASFTANIFRWGQIWTGSFIKPLQKGLTTVVDLASELDLEIPIEAEKIDIDGYFNCSNSSRIYIDRTNIKAGSTLLATNSFRQRSNLYTEELYCSVRNGKLAFDVISNYPLASSFSIDISIVYQIVKVVKTLN